jgi:hypothetical protein
MSVLRTLATVALVAAAVMAPPALAAKKTVCTITVNSADEKDTFRRFLPADQYEFVELVERGRPDWLASACRQGVRCDALIISGHHDNEQGFFSDRVEAGEYLNEGEMERVACSDSCPGLFSQLKEVYLFGCNTLNPDPAHAASGEIPRSLVRAGYARPDADRISRTLAALHADSGRDRMRRIFRNVPAIYGFSSVAPLGPTAAGLLRSHFQSSGVSEVATGRTSARLLSRFSAHSMVAVRGYTDTDANASYRRDVCQFADDRLDPAARVAFVHTLLDRDAAEARLFLDRIEHVANALTPEVRAAPRVSAALDAIARDAPARQRFLDLARDADEPRTRARMTRVAGHLGWLSPDDERAELRAMIDARLAASAVTPGDVDLVCSLNHDGLLTPERERLQVPGSVAAKASTAGILACLGSSEARSRVLEALTSPREDDVAIAQVVLRHRPIQDVEELRAVTASVARMTRSPGQVRALETLAHQRLSDPESIEEIARLYPVADSPGVQNAIAGILIRSDFQGIDRPELAQTLRDHRLGGASGGGGELIDVLIRRLQAY